MLHIGFSGIGACAKAPVASRPSLPTNGSRRFSDTRFQILQKMVKSARMLVGITANKTNTDCFEVAGHVPSTCLTVRCWCCGTAGWNIHNQPFMGDGQPMPRKFAFTADNEMGELHLGGYDPQIIGSDFAM
jgi:hypothetical protein